MPPVPPSPPGAPGRLPRASVKQAAGSSCSAPEAAGSNCSAADAVGHTASVSGLLPPRPPSMSWMLPRFWPASVRHSIGVVGPISPAPASGHSWPSSCSPPGSSGVPPSPPGSGTPPGRPSRASMKQAAGSRPSSDVTGHRASVSGLPPSRPPSARPPSRPSRSPKPPPSSSRQSNGVVGPISSPAATGQICSRAMPAPGICGEPPPGAEGS